jgi:hypothetical protein
MAPPALSKNSGVTLVEIAFVLVLSGILLAGGAAALSKWGSKNRVKNEAAKIVNSFWELRSNAVSGMKNPCMDFPAADSVRLYSDTSSNPNGFGPGDRLLGGFKYKAGVRALDLIGGDGANHFVCFESRGAIGATTAALYLELGAGPSKTVRVQLLPSTGIARIL